MLRFPWEEVPRESRVFTRSRGSFLAAAEAYEGPFSVFERRLSAVEWPFSPSLRRPAKRDPGVQAVPRDFSVFFTVSRPAVRGFSGHFPRPSPGVIGSHKFLKKHGACAICHPAVRADAALVRGPLHRAGEGARAGSAACATGGAGACASQRVRHEPPATGLEPLCQYKEPRRLLAREMLVLSLNKPFSGSRSSSIPNRGRRSAAFRLKRGSTAFVCAAAQVRPSALSLSCPYPRVERRRSRNREPLDLKAPPLLAGRRMYRG